MACEGCTGTCLSGCDGCDGLCDDSCKGSCEGDCSGYCDTGCNSTCTDSCSENCAYNCDGSCKGSCSNGCTGTCKTQCNVVCTAANTAAIVAALGAGIVQDQRINPADYINVKNAMINEFRRRGNTSYVNNYSVMPVSGGKILLEHGRKILDDVYTFDNSKDWRNNIVPGSKISAAALRPAVEYIKTLMNTVVPVA